MICLTLIVKFKLNLKCLDEEMGDWSIEPTNDTSTSDALDRSAQPAMATPEPPVAVSGGRRRGRRKVMKKKTIKDEEGYLGVLTVSMSNDAEVTNSQQ